MSAHRITEALRAHGHYQGEFYASEDPEAVMWILDDVQAMRDALPSYEGIDEALVRVGLHNPRECNDVCVRSVLEAL